MATYLTRAISFYHAFTDHIPQNIIQHGNNNLLKEGIEVRYWYKENIDVNWQAKKVAG